MPQPERRLVKRIQTLLRQKGARPFKIWGDEEGFQEAGIPDLLVCYRGFFIGLEAKQPGAEKSLRPKQAKILREIEAAGGVSAVVSTVGEVERILAKLDRKEVK